jgi:hypothetical protein
MDARDTVVHIERVCCLECGANYVKPVNGSAAQSDAGCPRCGYLGWISAIVPCEDADRTGLRGMRPRRFAADPPPSRALKRR